MKIIAFIFLIAVLVIAASALNFVRNGCDAEKISDKVAMLTGLSVIVMLITGFVSATYIIARL